MTQQKVIFIISETDKGHKIKLEFVPPLAGKDKFEKMSEAKRKLQTFASSLAKSVMDVLKQP